jgi:hypothetical protein
MWPDPAIRDARAVRPVRPADRPRQIQLLACLSCEAHYLKRIILRVESGRLCICIWFVGNNASFARIFAMRGTQFAELSAFVAVAEHRNFTKAAAQLGVSPSTLSDRRHRLRVRAAHR